MRRRGADHVKAGNRGFERLRQAWIALRACDRASELRIQEGVLLEVDAVPGTEHDVVDGQVPAIGRTKAQTIARG